MIGGSDYIFLVDRVGDGLVQELTLQFFRRVWPTGVVETDFISEAVPVSEPSAWAEVIRANDLYFYESHEAEKLWTEFGAVGQNHNTMVYVIVDSPGDVDGIRVTAVVSELTDDMSNLLRDLRMHVQTECHFCSVANFLAEAA